jgi:DNA polymerase alpha subunit B
LLAASFTQHVLSRSQAHQGRINATSVLLEGSRHTAGGARIELDLSHLKEQSNISYSLFPGQIVAVEGMNTSGRKLVANRICEGAAHAPLKSPVKELLNYHYESQEGLPLNLVAVAGPFTTSDNLNYQPLVDLLNSVVKKDNPDVVILTGPFVDVRHMAVKSGQTTLQDEEGEDILVPYETFFLHKIALLLEDLYAEDSSILTQFVLQPSLEDATAEWV